MSASKANRWSRRQFIQTGIFAGLATATGRGSWPALASTQKVLDREAWAALIELSEGVWAVESTPLTGNDWRTGCNGGLVAGKERVLAIEGFLRPEGARWLSAQAERLTGRRPTDVLVSHFHGDHASGLEGYANGQAPRVWMTPTTRRLIREDDARGDEPPTDQRTAMLESATLIDESRPMELDLGGRSVAVHPRRGHTPSDVSVEIAEPSIVFGGDLVWNGFFPNYRDTLASEFTAAIRALRRDHDTTYVPGHGRLARGSDVDALLRMVESVGQAASEAHENGTPLAEAASEYQLPESLSEWVLFNPKYFEVAFKAWYAELG